MSDPCNGLSGTTILVVDDVPDNLHLLQSLLSEEGYTVRAAPSGERALAYARATPPDLVLLDLRMPGMDGFEVCRYLKADDTTCHIPVLFISAYNEAADIARCFEAGGVDYITKPIKSPEVLARVRTHLSLHRLQTRLEAQVLCRTAELEASLRRQEALLREVHHRTRNNMMVMMNLIEMQVPRQHDQKARDSLVTLKERIHAMALVHQCLHQENLSYLSVADLLPRLCGSVQVYHAEVSSRVGFVYHTCELSLPVDSTIPLAMVIRELVANSLSHAFPDGRSGELVLSVAMREDSSCWLEIRDNGCGFDPVGPAGNPDGLGLPLARLLVEHQLGGIFKLDSGSGGTCVRCSFVLDQYQARI